MEVGGGLDSCDGAEEEDEDEELWSLMGIFREKGGIVGGGNIIFIYICMLYICVNVLSLCVRACVNLASIYCHVDLLSANSYFP